MSIIDNVTRLLGLCAGITVSVDDTNLPDECRGVQWSPARRHLKLASDMVLTLTRVNGFHLEARSTWASATGLRFTAGGSDKAAPRSRRVPPAGAAAAHATAAACPNAAAGDDAGVPTKPACLNTAAGDDAEVPTKAAARRRGCATCGRQGSKLRVCRKCERVFYCNSDCQRSNWSEHKRSRKPVQ